MIAKIVLLCAAFAVAIANPILTTSIINTGVSTSARSQDGLGNYAFNYGIGDGLGATNARAEIGDAAGNKQGSYTITDIDGRARRVDYVADAAAPALAAAPLLAAPGRSSYSTVIGHGATLGLPLGAGLLAPGIAKTIVW
ncbi:Adult-specific rigid cuticular protein 15.7 like protein [Argiope bruennichi]|uniref:Adult-specific rigid cuticular protein 15.7 like protein n=1 Tax=Argiope bruennichi TaxID=94029 RepID=A0A8T0E038_ARGBR|nr:Adult-specific rigid cuticular protein 15.7 like protein [Argiope bruennichi]